MIIQWRHRLMTAYCLLFVLCLLQTSEIELKVNSRAEVVSLSPTWILPSFMMWTNLNSLILSKQRQKISNQLVNLCEQYVKPFVQCPRPSTDETFSTEESFEPSIQYILKSNCIWFWKLMTLYHLLYYYYQVILRKCSICFLANKRP